MAKKITQITVQQMYDALASEIRKGNGNKYLIAADDNEGNGYHGIFFCISPVEKSCLDLISDSQIEDPNKLLIIG